MSFRPAVRKDLLSISRMWLSLSRDVGRLSPSLEPSESAAAAVLGKLRSAISSGMERVMVCETGGKIVGFAWASIERQSTKKVKKICFLDDIFVLKGNRSAGVGKTLVRSIEGWARAKGARFIILATHVKNRRAISFYGREGFRPMILKMEKRT